MKEKATCLPSKIKLADGTVLEVEPYYPFGKDSSVSNAYLIYSGDSKGYDNLKMAKSYIEDATRDRCNKHIESSIYCLEVALRELIIFLEKHAGSKDC